MGTEAGQAIPDLIAQLCKDSKRYSFFQMVYLLENYLPRDALDGEPARFVGEQAQNQVAHEVVRFRPEASFNFSVSDISELEYLPQSPQRAAHFRLTASFIGLYGSVSPLPAFFTEAIIAADLDEHQRRDFMDVFHHRFYSLFYRIWKKYRYYIQYQTGAKDPFSQWMFSLIGLGDERLRADEQVHWVRLLSYSGLLGMRSRSATVLENILSHYFFKLPVKIEQCVLRRVPIEPAQQNRIGQANCAIGESFVIGESVPDRAGKFRLVLGPLGFERFQDFLPPGRYFQPLRTLVKFLLIDQLDFDVKLILKKEEVPVWSFSSDSPCRLGWSVWGGDVGKDGEVILKYV